MTAVSSKPQIAVVGAGLVGARHAREVAHSNRCELAGIVDPDPAIKSLTQSLATRWFESMESLPEKGIDGVIIATPNTHHRTAADIACTRRWPSLLEKPIADTVEDATAITQSYTDAGVPLLIGHHRRYHPFVTKAKALIESGELGVPVFASVIWAVRKPDDYFVKGAWRKSAGGGPIMINLIHDIDLMHYFFGPVNTVQALTSCAQREGETEDTAGVLLHFISGLIATVALTDAALSPWSFEGASGENPTIAATQVPAWRIGCSQGSFDFPGLTFWKDAEGKAGDWTRTLTSNTLSADKVIPFSKQLEHFIDLVTGVASTPAVSGQDATEALRCVAAIADAAKSGQRLTLTSRSQGSNTPDL